jgi:hypothetical protein
MKARDDVKHEHVKFIVSTTAVTWGRMLQLIYRTNSTEESSSLKSDSRLVSQEIRHHL